jgi:hypothetical protein
MTQSNPVPDFSLAPANLDEVPDFSLAPANLDEIYLPGGDS